MSGDVYDFLNKPIGDKARQMAENYEHEASVRQLSRALMSVTFSVDPNKVTGFRLFAYRQALRTFAAVVRGLGDKADAALVQEGKLASELVAESNEISERLEIAEQRGPVS